MSSTVYSAIGSVGSVLTHPTVFVAMWKYVFSQGWSFPFYSVFFINGLLFIAGVAYFLYKLYKYSDPRKPLFYLPGYDIILLSVPYCCYIIGTVFSLARDNMNAGRYLMLAPVQDFFWMGLWSSLILQRQLSIFHWVSFILAGIGYVMYDIVEYNGDYQFNFSIKERNTWDDWKGPLWASLARASYVLSGVLSKRLLLKRGFRNKLEEFEADSIKKDIQKAKFIVRDKRTPAQKFDDYKRKAVSQDSMVYRRAMYQKKEFIRRKQEELREIQENIKNEQNNLNKKYGGYNRPTTAEQERMKNINTGMYKKMKNLKEIAAMRDYSGEKRRIKVKDLQKEREYREQREEILRILKEEEEKNFELETFLNDYNDVKFHMHLFSGFDDITLSKIDYIMDNPTYDTDLIGISEECTFELYGIGGALSLFPIACFFSLMNEEIPGAFDALVRNEVIGPFGQGTTGFIVLSVFSLLFALRPYFIHKMIFTTTHGYYFSLNMMSHFFVLVYSIIFVDVLNLVPSTQGAGLMFTALAYGVFFVGINNQATVMESISNMEALKTMLPLHEMTEEEIENLDLKMMEIQNILGDQALLRIMLDTALSRNPNGLNYTANPVLVSRVLFDSDYYHR